MRIADALDDGVGVNVATIDVPAIVAIVGAAAGKIGNTVIERASPELGKRTTNKKAAERTLRPPGRIDCLLKFPPPGNYDVAKPAKLAN
jgi:hypothetical protein